MTDYTQERARAHAQRWATPGDDPFEQWYWKLQRYFNRRVDPEILAVYRKVLGRIPAGELDAVFESYILQPDIGREPPKAGTLYHLWSTRKKRQKERIEDKKPARAVDSDDQRKQMFPLIANELLGANQIWTYAGDAPDWMRDIARWAGQQFRDQHPGKLIHEISDSQRQAFFDQALELFDSERVSR